MSEKSQNHTFRDKLSKFGHIHRIENSAGIGTPDINCCFSGHEHWIESKCLDAWPVREISVRLKHPFKLEQRVWFRRRLQAGGHPLLYLKIESTDEHFIFDGKMAVEHVDREGGLTRQGMVQYSLFHCGARGFPAVEMLGFLTSPETYRRFLTR